MSAAERVKSYPNDCLTVNHKQRLFCNACREPLALKKSVIDHHIASQKHLKGKEKVASREKRERDIVESLRLYDRTVHPVGETLPDEMRVYRVKVVTAMLKAGIPLSKVNVLRDLLEEYGLSLTSSSNLADLLPFILQSELDHIKKEINGRYVSVIFDGTTHVCEAMVVVLRFLDDDMNIQQRVTRLMLLAKSLTGQEVARQLISSISTELGIGGNLVIAMIHDRASVNSVAMRTVSVLYTDFIDVGCLSHTIDLVGKNMKTPFLDKFFKSWVQLFSHSPKARLIWRTQTGLPVPSYSPTRWWSRFEVVHHLFRSFGDVNTFLQNPDLPPSAKKLLDLLNDPPTMRKLQVEIAITIDAMEAFVKATYNLEGDGPLALTTYEEVRKLFAVISAKHYPNVAAVAKRLSRGNSTHEKQLVAYGCNCVQPAFDYFELKFNNDLKSVVNAFMAAQYFSPSKMSELRPTANDLDKLAHFPFLKPKIPSLKAELPSVLAACEGVHHSVNPIDWWKSHGEQFKTWLEAFKLVLLVQPSSASAERVFSLLTNSFSRQQESALEDYIQLSVLLQYNYCKKI